MRRRSDRKDQNSMLNEHTTNQIADLLTPLLQTEDRRRALLQRCCAALSTQIDFDGPAGDFATRLVAQLVEYGEVEPGKPALLALLETARARVGLDQQAHIDELCADIARDLFHDAQPRRRVYTDAYRQTRTGTGPLADPEIALLVAAIVSMDANGGYDTAKVLQLKREYPDHHYVIDTALQTRMADRQKRIVDEQQLLQAQVVQLSANVEALRQNQEAFGAEQSNCGVRQEMHLMQSRFEAYFRLLLSIVIVLVIVVIALVIAVGLHLVGGI